jgi:hypothetical protein
MSQSAACDIFKLLGSNTVVRGPDYEQEQLTKLGKKERPRNKKIMMGYVRALSVQAPYAYRSKRTDLVDKTITNL